MNAQSDVGTLLYVKGQTDYDELIEIKNVPASGSAGGTLEMTTMKMTKKGYLPDRPDTPDQDFTYNYTDANYTAVVAVCTGLAKEFLVKYQDGSGTYIKGIAQTWKNELGLPAVAEATLHIVAETITDKTEAEMEVLLGEETA